jgi:hypothetical protein
VRSVFLFLLNPMGIPLSLRTKVINHSIGDFEHHNTIFVITDFRYILRKATLPTDEEESEVPMDCRGAISL